MTTILRKLLALTAACLVLQACHHGQAPGSVSRENVVEMLQSPRMAVTPALPGWVIEGEQNSISPLSAAEITSLRGILLPEQVRTVAEKYYRSPSMGNRGDDSDLTFYIYASNAQCLGGRVVGDPAGEWSVKMDDFDLKADQEAQLKTLLAPHLKKIHVLPE